jgi:F0F1-type ATP synthase assembly protein I
MKKESKRRTTQKVMGAFAMVIQFSLYMIVPIMMCTLIGVWLGKKYDIPIITVPLFILGALAGFNNIYKMAKKLSKQDGETKN